MGVACDVVGSGVRQINGAACVRFYSTGCGNLTTTQMHRLCRKLTTRNIQKPQNGLQQTHKLDYNHVYAEQQL